MKTCTGCKETKPEEEFHKNKTGKDGLESRCKDCKKSWRKGYIEENREHIADYQRDYRRKNRKQIAEHQKDYFQNNPESLWLGKYRYRTKLYGLDPVVESFTLADLIDRYGDACWHCGKPWEELDHYPVAVSKGGSHTLDNVRPSCLKCNRPGNNVRK